MLRLLGNFNAVISIVMLLHYALLLIIRCELMVVGFSFIVLGDTSDRFDCGRRISHERYKHPFIILWSNACLNISLRTRVYFDTMFNSIKVEADNRQPFRGAGHPTSEFEHYNHQR
jgi:hypothetical protein